MGCLTRDQNVLSLSLICCLVATGSCCCTAGCSPLCCIIGNNGGAGTGMLRLSLLYEKVDRHKHRSS